MVPSLNKPITVLDGEDLAYPVLNVPEKASAQSPALCPEDWRGHRRNLPVDWWIAEAGILALGKGQCFLNPGWLEMWAIGERLWGVAYFFIQLVSHFKLFFVENRNTFFLRHNFFLMLVIFSQAGIHLQSPTFLFPGWLRKSDLIWFFREPRIPLLVEERLVYGHVPNPAHSLGWWIKF